MSQDQPPSAQKPLTDRNRTQDEARIRETAAAFAAAFNAHDPVAFAETFASDGDFTNVRGDGASGRDNIARFNESVFATLFAEAQFRYTVRRIRFLAVDIAAVELDWEITGSKGVNGDAIPLRVGRIDWVMTNEDGRWLIKIMHNRQASPSL